MTCTKGERLSEIMRRLKEAAPFGSANQAREALETVMYDVEDELSGIPAHPDPVNAGPDGRMYPPHDRFEKKTDCSKVRWFRQARHSTYFGENGAIRITTSSDEVVVDLEGSDGDRISDLMERNNE